MRGSSLPLLLLGAMACAVRREERPTVESKLPDTFALLSNVVELRDGRVMFADTRAKLFFSADFTSGRIDTLGTRVDSLEPSLAPASYRFPGWVAHLAADSIALVDFSAVRTTIWNEQGRPLGILPVPPVGGPSPVLAYDTVGHGYKTDYQAVLGGTEPGRAVLPDSIPLLRIDLAKGTTDTVAKLTGPEYGEAQFGEQVQIAAKVFGPNDYFGVLPDGTLWIARGRENRVDWRSPKGEWTLGTPRKYTAIPVTQDDRDRALAQVRERGQQFGMPQGLQIKYPFATTKPAFDDATGRANGEVWLHRTRAKSSEPARYDVVDRHGTWRVVTFPAGATLAGFGRDGVVYASVAQGERRGVARLRVR